VQYKSITTGASRAAKYVLAAVLGVLAVGVLLVIAAFFTRSRGGPGGVLGERRTRERAAAQ
jgi:hypothetical protein